KLIIGSLVLIVLLVASVAAIWFVWAPPITQQTDQQDSGDITLKAEVVLSGLNNPWDVAFLPDKTLIFSDRSGGLNKLVEGKKVLIQRIDDVQATGEGGFTGMTIDSDFANNRYVYTC